MRDPQGGSFSWPASHMRDDAFLMPRGSDGRHPRTPTEVIASIPSPPRTVFTCRIPFPASFYRMDLKIYNMCYCQRRQNGSQVTVYQSKYTVVFPVAHSWKAETSEVWIISNLKTRHSVPIYILYINRNYKMHYSDFLWNIAVHFKWFIHPSIVYVCMHVCSGCINVFIHSFIMCPRTLGLSDNFKITSPSLLQHLFFIFFFMFNKLFH